MIAFSNGDGALPSLVELALDKAINGFLSGRGFSVSFFHALKPEIALAFYARLSLPTDKNSRTIASFVENDGYWKRSCYPKGRVEEHGLSHKRMFFELQFEHIFKGVEKEGQEAIIDKIRPFADYIYTVKLCGPRGQCPIDIVCSNLPNLININLKHASGLKESLPKAIASSPLLTNLALVESQINDDDVALIVDTLADSGTLLHLDLSNNKISSHGTTAITEKLIAPESILSCLDLSGNRISSEGASVLGQAITTNESLLTLALRLNNIGDEGGKDLFEGLAQNTILRHLNMSANKLGPDSASYLLSIVENKSQDCALESIILTSNTFSEDELIDLRKCQIFFIDVRTIYEPDKNDNATLASEIPFSKLGAK